MVRLTRRGEMTDRVLDLLGVSLFFHPVADTNQGWAYPVWEKKDRYELVYQDNKFELYRNKKVLPMAILFYDYKIIKNDSEIIKSFYDQNFDFRKVLILESDPKIKPAPDGKGESKIIAYSPDKVVIKVKTDKPAMLFFSDNYYPSWEAKVNGQKVTILRADYSFKAVPVSEGESTVELSMRWF